MKKIFTQIFIFSILSIFLLSCARPRSPVEKLEAKLAGVPEYSIILNDMQMGGTFFKSYHHKYKVVQGEEAFLTNWLRVSENTFRNNQKFLGMTLVSKSKDGQKTNTPYPPGYQYVGNAQYGQWRQDNRGNSFWEFYGKYALISSLFGMGHRPFYRSDYNNYRTYQTNRRPYFGPKREYGTGGTHTKRTNPTFFERRMAKQKMAKSSFSKRVNSRFGGSRSTYGSGRGFGGFGK